MSAKTFALTATQKKALETPGGISDFLVAIQTPLHAIQRRLYDVGDRGYGLSRETASCPTCRQETAERRADWEDLSDSSQNLTELASEIDDAIATFSEFDPDDLMRVEKALKESDS